MNQSKKISVIIIVYAVESYFRQCLESVIAQTYTNLEIILVLGLKNGKPVDNCIEIAEEFAKRDDRIKLALTEARGAADARNNGLKLVTGDLLGFVDSDDYIEPDMFESMVNNLEKYKAQISICGRYYEFMNQTKSDLGDIRILSAKDALKTVISYDGFFLHCWDKLYTKEIFQDLYFPTDSYVEDRIVVDKMLSKAGTICYDPTPKYHFRERTGSLSKVVGVSKYNDEANRRLIDFILNKYPELRDECGRFELYEKITCLQNALISEVRDNSEEKRYRQDIKMLIKKECNNKLIGTKIKIKAYIASYLPGVLRKMTIRNKKKTDEGLVRFS